MAAEHVGRILDAPVAASQNGGTHQPANIPVDKQRIKLVDFGLAK